MEESPPLFNHTLERSDGSKAVSDGGERRRIQSTTPPATSWRTRAKRAKASALQPRFLGAVGAVLLAVSIGLIAAGAALPNQSTESGVWTPPPAAQRDSEGVPLDALQPPDPGSVSECNVGLGDWESYIATATHAEGSYIGSQVAHLSVNDVMKAIDALTPLRIRINFWVLSSPAHPWSFSFIDAAAIQVSILNAAYKGVKISFQLDGVHGISATDEDVEQCVDSDGVAGALVSQLITSIQTNGTAIHIVVCEPDGVNGATQILGSSNEDASERQDEEGGVIKAPLHMAITLRRSTLWLSRTSLVHQLGHFFGLPHPFPDSQSCKYDGDGIADTPQLYRGSTGCDNVTLEQLPLCDEEYPLDPGALPNNGFMDTTNDTCRQHFTPGQVLRMRSMLSVLRPQLYDASVTLWQGIRLPFVSAFQSALPPEDVMTKQLSLSNDAAIALAAKNAALKLVDSGSGNGGKKVKGRPPLPAAAVEAAGRLTSTLDHARLAAHGDDLLSLEKCSCVSPDASGVAFWTGELESSFLIDAVRVVQPWDVVQNATALMRYAVIERLISRASGLAQIVVAPGPSTESSIAALDKNSTNNSTAAGNTNAEGPLMEIRIGSSTLHEENAVCASVPFSPRVLSRTVACDTPMNGRFVTVQWLHAPLQWPLCVCDVAPLSFVDPPLHTSGSFPLLGALLNTTAAGAVQSSTLDAASSADRALPRSGSDILAAEGANLDATVQCSATAAELQPYWSLDFGINPKLISGVRLSLPFRCSGLSKSTRGAAWNTSELQCGALAAASAGSSSRPGGTLVLDIFVTDAPFKDLLPNELNDSVICASRVEVIPGRSVDINCGRYMRGRVLTVIPSKTSSRSGNDTPFSLSLCDVRPFGAEFLLMADAIDTRMQQVTVPPELMQSFTAAIDGDSSTCIAAAADGSGGGRAVNMATTQWKLRLKGDYSVVGVHVNGSSNLLVELIDNDENVIWSLPAGFNSNSSKSDGLAEMLPVAPALSVRSIRISNFSSLCEVSLAVASRRPVQYDATLWSTTPSVNRASVGEGGSVAAKGYTVSLSGVDASVAALMIDNDPRTCVPLFSSLGDALTTNDTDPAIVVKLSFTGGPRTVRTVRVLANATLYNVRVALVGVAHVDDAGVEPDVCGEIVELEPWALNIVKCNDAIHAEAVIITVPATQPAEAAALCEVLISSSGISLQP